MQTTLVKPRNHVRFVTAASLFDGHDASINIMRRILQAAGCEVIHLGHNRSVAEIVSAAIQEDAQGIAVSSYQGGHVEFFKYMRDLLVQQGAGHIKIFAGGGGTIVPREADDLHAYGITRVFSPEDGRKMGLEGMINFMVEACDFVPPPIHLLNGVAAGATSALTLGRLVTMAELEDPAAAPLRQLHLDELRRRSVGRKIPVVGVTGTGGAGKSSFIDELVRRFLLDFSDRTVAVLSVDPTKRKTGGALLGDRIRMNAINDPRVFMRSLATRTSGASLSAAIRDSIDIMKGAGHSVIIVETSGIGQGESSIVDISDVSIYVMTPEYGAASQLEKIDMIDLADIIVLNKFERPSALDALRDVRKQYRRSRGLFEEPVDDDLPVFGTISAQFGDTGVTAAYLELLRAMARKSGTPWKSRFSRPEHPYSTIRSRVIPGPRQRYLAEVSETCRAYRRTVELTVAKVRELESFEVTRDALRARGADAALATRLDQLAAEQRESLIPEARRLLAEWPALAESYRAPELVSKVRDKEMRRPLRTVTLAGLSIPKVAIPRADS